MKKDLEGGFSNNRKSPLHKNNRITNSWDLCYSLRRREPLRPNISVAMA